MTSCGVGRGALVLLTALWCATLMGSINAQSPDIGTEAQRESGKALYLTNSSPCHGEKGQGAVVPDWPTLRLAPPLNRPDLRPTGTDERTKHALRAAEPLLIPLSGEY